MDLEVAKVSSAFADAVGRPIIQGLRITDVLAFGDRERMGGLQRQMQDEQARREPNYLPPIPTTKTLNNKARRRSKAGLVTTGSVSTLAA
ncbi:hypothetical protein VPNG_04790 [Cytospora leucostoma]|uniref:Uncharacterized protein n=1 Tax=Cytospora leucostoma TaxID=1230097 RepID=A0A423XB64_9PEZI|nr:hypothetical protein VPNG_04790 [Cytospora leucostoma]